MLWKTNTEMYLWLYTCIAQPIPVTTFKFLCFRIMNEIQGVILSMFLFWLHFKIIDLDNIFIQNLNGIGQQDKSIWALSLQNNFQNNSRIKCFQTIFFLMCISYIKLKKPSIENKLHVKLKDLKWYELDTVDYVIPNWWSPSFICYMYFKIDSFHIFLFLHTSIFKQIIF